MYWGGGHMADRSAPGAPYRWLGLENGATTPFYIVPFDKDGLCSGPLTAQGLVDCAADGTITDVFLFSHGWNNDWAAAIRRYDDFIEGFSALRARYPVGRQFRPLLAGIFWPSTALVAPWEHGPEFAGGAGRDHDAGAAEQAELDEVAAVVPEGQRARFYALAQRADGLGADEAAEFAALVAAAFAGDDELRSASSVAPDEVLGVWRATPATAPRPVGDDFGFAADDAPDPQAAGRLRALDPRSLIRLATVLRMKDRAGRVGARGVADLLSSVLAATSARVHLVGHSYGAKVVLSALVATPDARPVDSVLLLQPAVSYLCFTADVDGTGRPGGYRPALSRAGQPIMTTFSRNDVPLTKFFQWAARRASDLGEVQIAGVPSRYAALGGFGPGAVDGQTVQVLARLPAEPYPAVPAGIRVVAVESSEFIKGHGDISNEATHWMLLNQVLQGG
jgi:hypothetical protein